MESLCTTCTNKECKGTTLKIIECSKHKPTNQEDTGKTLYREHRERWIDTGRTPWNTQ